MIKNPKNPSSLVSLLSQEQPVSKSINSIASLFSSKIPQEEKFEEEDENFAASKEKLPYIDENASALMNKDRTERTIFIGNIDLGCSKKEIQKLFKQYGEIESLWERSLPLNNDSKLPLKAKAITKDFSKTMENPTKNCYILFKEKESAIKALESNNLLFHNRHLRVDSCGNNENDYQTTIFVGNLPYQINEENLREHFNTCGTILSVRIIRDPVTRVGKGFGYLKFQDKEGYKKALQLNNSVFEKRQIRVRKALDPEKLQEKAEKKENIEKKTNKTNAERRLKKKEKKNLKGLKNFAQSNTLEKNELEDLEIKNIITHGKSLLKKRINKKNLPQSVKAKQLEKVSKKLSQKHDKNLFNGVNMLEKRRVLRKKKAELNKKKIALSRKN